MIDTSKIYTSKSYGDYEVVKAVSTTSSVIRFIDTGYSYEAKNYNIVNGIVKDRLMPSIYAAGFIGVGPHASGSNGVNSKAYKTWFHMLERCYSKEVQRKNPTYVGCYVCDKWLNFQNFAEWFHENYIDGFTLDKDIKTKGNKIYSPETCLFVSAADNIVAASAKHYVLVSPEGVKTSIYNLSEFCRGKGLSQGHMSAVHLGNRLTHKGWTRSEEK